MSAATLPKTQKLELGAHQAGVAVDGFHPQTASLQQFSDELTARLAELEESLRRFQTRKTIRKALRG